MITNNDREDKLWTTSEPPSGLIYGDETEEEKKKRIAQYKTKKLLEEQFEARKIRKMRNFDNNLQ